LRQVNPGAINLNCELRRIPVAMKQNDTATQDAFAALVNMDARELAGWLKTEASRSVGQDSGDGESIGRKSGKRILAVLRKKGPANAGDIEHMRRVVSFIRRHSAQPPRRNVATSRWCYSLMNWGHDPLKPGAQDTPWR
jgi:hypothetical protein